MAQHYRDDISRQQQAQRRPSESQTPDEPSPNPRKRKKSSRACDFCHVNHQPCDNIQPQCGYCERHGKACLYMRPQKKRGPAQGYRNTLHTLRESAAAWGAALNLVPTLGPVLEGYLKQPEGQRLISAVKDPQQQEFFIQSWQQSSVFKVFFDNAEGQYSDADATHAPAALGSDGSRDHAVRPSLSSQTGQVSSQEQPNTQSQNHAVAELSTVPHASVQQTAPPQKPSNPHHPNSPHTAFAHNTPSLSLSELVARDAARPSQGFDKILGSLGFAPGEGFEDFVAMSSNPEPFQEPIEDPDLLPGSEMDQKAFYELLMGKQFPQ